MKRLRIIVSGRVQGVFFRASAKKEADKLSLHGTVQNLPTGSVFIDVQGEVENVNQFLNWCYKGSDLSKVEKVEFSMEEELEGFKEFEIIR